MADFIDFNSLIASLIKFPTFRVCAMSTLFEIYNLTKYLCVQQYLVLQIPDLVQLFSFVLCPYRDTLCTVHLH